MLERLKTEARQRGIVALHLEVARENVRARQLYRKWGFRARDRFTLMSCGL
jgi:ribosomal protein S18 acetylase RimI-like enzyme